MKKYIGTGIQSGVAVCRSYHRDKSQKKNWSFLKTLVVEKCILGSSLLSFFFLKLPCSHAEGIGGRRGGRERGCEDGVGIFCLGKGGG